MKSDDLALPLRRTLPSLQTDIALRKLAGVLGQLIAALSLLMWTTYVIAYLTGLAAVERGSEGVLFVAPFVCAIAVVAGLYRIDPERVRSRRLLAQILDERALSWKASAHTPPPSAFGRRTPTTIAWTYRLSLLALLSLTCIVGIGIRALSEGASWSQLVEPWWDLPLAIAVVLLLFGLVLFFFHSLSVAIVWARFWIGGVLGTIIGALIAIVFVIITVSFVTGVIIAGYVRGDWGLTSLFVLAVVASTLGEVLPLFVKWQPPLRVLPGYAVMRQFSIARAEYIGRLMDRLEPRLAALSAEERAQRSRGWRKLFAR